MTTAYLLVSSEPGMEQRVAEELILIEYVKSTDIVYGEYDLVVKVQLEDISQLSDFILNRIRPVQGVVRTSTLIVAKE